jgi:hypothetical protein
MGFLKFSKDKALDADKGFGLIEPGDYEFLIQKAEWRVKGQSTPNFNLTLVIRSDFEQDYKGRMIFHSFYISKDPSKVENSMNMLQSFLLKIGAADGQDFTTEAEVAAFMVGKAVAGEIYTDVFEGKEKSKARNFSISDLAGGVEKKDTTMGKATETKVTDDPFANDGKTIDISDDDLPF